MFRTRDFSYLTSREFKLALMSILYNLGHKLRSSESLCKKKKESLLVFKMSEQTKTRG